MKSQVRAPARNRCAQALAGGRAPRHMFVYILQSLSSKRYYVGYTGNLRKRLSQHNNGNTVSTRNKGPWKLVFNQRFETKSKAIKAEKKLKRFKSRSILENIIKDGELKAKFDW